MENALRSASGLILNSAATKRAVVEFACSRAISMPNSLIAWLGIDTKPAMGSAVATARDRPYFVMIGTIEARKNHLMMLEVWREIVGRMGSNAPDLIVIGQRGWEATEAISILEDSGQLCGHIHEMAGCCDVQMSDLLAGAHALLMPSFVEGFGLPLVEALQQGVPAIASDLPVFREIAQGIPTYLDPCDRASWTNAVIEYCGNGGDRQRQLKAISGYRAPTWSDHFGLVENFLEKLS
jgi:glycosyltransferase involved in cell wall biosynthesis